MITDYRIIHTTYSELSRDDLRGYDCPICGAKERTQYYSHYNRHVVSLNTDVLIKIFAAEGDIDTETICNAADELFEDTLLDTFRVKCQSCNTTHAILPGDVVPYRRFSLFSMLAIVKVMYHREHTIEKTASHLQLSWQYMLALLNQWISHLHGMALLMRAIYNERINEAAAKASQTVIKFVSAHRASFPESYHKEHRKIIFKTHGQIHKGKKVAFGMAASN